MINSKISIKNSNLIFMTLLLTCMLYSCEQEVNLSLNSTEAKIVIEGIVTDQRVPYEVKISSSLPFNSASQFIPISNAFVSIADNLGNIDTLKEAFPGKYRTSKLRGVAGRRYQLTVVHEGKKYIASSTLVRAVGLDSVVITKDELSTTFNAADKVTYNILPVFDDPRDELNYYFFEVYSKSDRAKGFFNLLSDINSDGQTNFESIFYTTDASSRDSINVEMWCIDRDVHAYFNAINQLDLTQSGTPTNPVSNIKGGALGYFSAHSVRTKKVAVP